MNTKKWLWGAAASDSRQTDIEADDQRGAIDGYSCPVLAEYPTVEFLRGQWNAAGCDSQGQYLAQSCWRARLP